MIGFAVKADVCQCSFGVSDCIHYQSALLSGTHSESGVFLPFISFSTNSGLERSCLVSNVPVSNLSSEYFTVCSISRALCSCHSSMLLITDMHMSRFLIICASFLFGGSCFQIGQMVANFVQLNTVTFGSVHRYFLWLYVP